MRDRDGGGGERALTPRGGCAPLEAAAERLGATSDALALAAVLTRPWVDVVVLR